MKQVTQNLRNGAVDLREVPDATLKSGGILVRTLYTLISPGTEGATAELSRQGLLEKARRRPDLARQVLSSVRRDGLRATMLKVSDRLDTPKAPGYSLAGQVVQVANDVPQFRVGDPVACAGEGYASHAETVFVPQNLATRVPLGVLPEEAAFGTLGAIALHGVRQTSATLGETVVVVGLGLIGQIAWQILEAAGIRAVGVDIDPQAVDLARKVGLSRAHLCSDPVEHIVQEATSGLGADAVLITASSTGSEPLRLAGQICRDRARVVILGSVRADIPRSPYYEKELEIRMSRSYGPGRYDPTYEIDGNDYPPGFVRWTEQRNLGAFLDLVASDRVRLSELITHRFPVEKASEAYDLLTSKRRPAVAGIVLSYPASNDGTWPDLPSSPVTTARVTFYPARAPLEARRTDTNVLRIGFIGAGSFARGTLLPRLRRMDGVALTGVATAHPHTSHHVASKYGFNYATSRVEEILECNETDVVVITTRHDTHAQFAIRAMERGKAVFVEKPLALDRISLEEVMATQKQTGSRLCVGFNRRFAPMTVQLLKALPPDIPRFVQIRVNAGTLPPDHWLLDPDRGGGRLIGEGCHFIDLAGFLTGATPRAVSCFGAPGQFTAMIDYSDGSIASILYSASGDPKLPKERIEVFGGEVAVVLDDFRRLEVYRNNRRTRTRSRYSRKGHGELFAAYFKALREDSPLPIEPWSILESHRTLFALRESLVTSRTVVCSAP